MSALQHYYTSYVNKDRESGGFQTKGISPGVTEDMQAIILRLIAYRVPPSLEDRPIAEHPTALRYYYYRDEKNEKRYILLCSQSSGKDEYGRAGNFFAHTLVLSSDLFKNVPPIFYWKSSFWKREDDTDPGRLNAGLPLLALENEEPMLDEEAVWDFLKQSERRQQLYKLLCAVIHCSRTKRRIVILDTTEHVVLWIAAVSILLPEEYRPLLTFATYHHDPYQAQFMIVGARSDSSFRATAEEHISYFILDVERGITSEVEESSYAKFMVRHASKELYEEHLLPLFANYARRFPASMQIDEQLDQIVMYAEVLKKKNISTLRRQELQTISTAISSLQELQRYEDEDKEEAEKLLSILLAVFTTTYDAAVQKEYKRVQALCEKHQVATDKYVLDELMAYTRQLLRPEVLMQDEAMGSFSKLQDDYPDIFRDTVNRPAYLEEVLLLLKKRMNIQQVRRFWLALGGDLKPDRQNISCKQLLDFTLEIAAPAKERNEEGEILLKTIWQEVRGHEQEWLQFACMTGTQSISANALGHFYYCLVHTLPVEKRERYRQIMQPVYSDLLKYEMGQDIEIRSVDIKMSISILEDWMRYAQQVQISALEKHELLEQGLQNVQQKYPTQWKEQANTIFINPLLKPLPPKLEQELVDGIAAQTSLSNFSVNQLEVYKRCLTNKHLPQQERFIVTMVVEMIEGTMQEVLIKPINDNLSRMVLDEYRKSVSCCLNAFFENLVNADNHRRVVSTLLVSPPVHSWDRTSKINAFWQIYYDVLIKRLTRARMITAAPSIIDFWFAASPAAFSSPYTPHSFFLMLPEALKHVYKQPGFQENAPQFYDFASRFSWYPSVHPLFTERKGRWLPGLLRREPTQNEVENEKVSKKLAANVSALFLPNTIKGMLQVHRDLLPTIYRSTPREHFWKEYWKLFIAYVAHHANVALALLSFWFDDAFEQFAPVPCVTQEFFLGLADALSDVRKEHAFRKTRWSINEEIQSAHSKHYDWYTLVEPYLAERK